MPSDPKRGNGWQPSEWAATRKGKLRTNNSGDMHRLFGCFVLCLEPLGTIICSIGRWRLRVRLCAVVRVAFLCIYRSLELLWTCAVLRRSSLVRRTFARSRGPISCQFELRSQKALHRGGRPRWIHWLYAGVENPRVSPRRVFWLRLRGQLKTPQF